MGASALQLFCIASVPFDLGPFQERALLFASIRPAGQQDPLNQQFVGAGKTTLPLNVRRSCCSCHHRCMTRGQNHRIDPICYSCVKVLCVHDLTNACTRRSLHQLCHPQQGSWRCLGYRGAIIRCLYPDPGPKILPFQLKPMTKKAL